MSAEYKRQDQLVNALLDAWERGEHESVRNTIRGLKNKAQASFIAASMAYAMGEPDGAAFCAFLHPNLPMREASYGA